MKISISYKIIISYLLIILITSLFVSLIFNFSARRYMEDKVQKNLENDISRVTQSLEENFNVENDRLKQIAKLRVELGTVDNWALIGRDMKVIYPRTGDEGIRFNSIIYPAIKAGIEKGNKKDIRFHLDGIEYIAVYSNLKIKSAKPSFNGWIIIYTSVGAVKELRQGIIVVLLFSLLFTGLIAIILGIFFAKSIARPIIKLKRRTEMLAARDFDTRVEIKTGDELEELANTINKMAGELKEYDIAQKKFLQNASHELKTPLMSIQGYAEGIKDGVFDNNDQALNIIIDESIRLKGLVEEIIYLSKLETLEDFYKFTVESMNETIEKCVEKVNSIAIKGNIRINTMLAKDAQISIDKDKLNQALINILGNGLRYANSEINIMTANDGRWFEIRINDDGEGFGENEMKSVFKRFYKGNKGHTGLGLAITKVIIEKHRGNIGACNGTNGGAEFIIRIPIKQN